MKLKPVSKICLLLVFPVLAPMAAVSAADEAAMSGDELISARVTAVLAQDKRLRVQDPINVTTRNGVVSLAGEVESPSMVYRAVEKTRKIEGVREVDTHYLEAR